MKSELVEKAKKLYESGESTNEIASLLVVTPAMIRHHLAKNGVKLRRPGRRFGIYKDLSESTKDLIRRKKNKQSIGQIANEVGMTTKAVAARLAYHKKQYVK